MIIGRVQQRESVRQRVRLPLMVLGRVKLRRSNWVWKFCLDFVNLKTKSACDYYWDKTTEKTILRIFGSARFHTNQGQSRPNEASISLLYDWHCTLLQPKRSTLSGSIVETENLSVRVFPLACFLGQPKSLQSRDLFTNNLCLDFVAHRESVLPRSLLQPRLHSHVFRISGHGALSFTGAETRPHSVHTQHVCSVRIKYVCTKHDEKRPRTTSWRGRISGVGFAAKLERSNSINRAWASLANRSARQTWGLFASGPSFGFMFSYYRSTTIRTLSVELVWPSVGRLLRLRQKYRDFETQKWWCRIDFRNAGYVSI